MNQIFFIFLRNSFLNNHFSKALRPLSVVISILASTVCYGQTDKGTISGVVKDLNGHALSNAQVIIKGTSVDILTNSKGQYSLSISPGTYTLRIQTPGFVLVEKTLEVKEGQNVNANIVLQEDILSLDAVDINAVNNKFVKEESEYVSKIPLKNLENSQVYSSVTKELLKEQLVFSVDDGLRNVPGIQKMWEATGRGGDGGAFYNLRGFIGQSQLRNGVAGNVTSRIDAANLERIEVIKGPSATLFGSTLTSYGGLINRVTKKPYDTLGGEISYAGGSFGFNRVSADVNIPLDQNKNLLMRLNTAYFYEGSFQDNGFDKGYVIAPSISYKVSDKLSFMLDVEFYNGMNTGKPFIFFYYPSAQLGTTRAKDLGLDYNRSYSSNDLNQISRSANFFGVMNYKISDKWVSQTNFTTSHSYSDGALPYFYMVPNSVVTGDSTATGSDYLVRAVQATSSSEKQISEIQQNFIGDFKIGALRNRFVFGLNFFHQNSNQYFYGADFDTIPKNGEIPTYSNFNKTNFEDSLRKGYWTWPSEYKTSTYSAYISDVVNITENIIVSAALRLDHFDNKGTFNEATGKFSGNYVQTALSPKFGLVYQPVKDKVSLFANYQNGFTNKTGTDFAGRTFRPEKANQMEGGVKLNAFNGRLSSTISYYNIKVEDIVRTYPVNPIYSVQDGTQISKGVEAEIIATPVNGLNIVAGFAYNDSHYEKADAEVEGRRPATAMSPYAANLWLSYKILGGKVKGIGVGVGGNYASDNKIVNSAYYGEFILPAYTVLHSTIFYEHSKFRVGIKVDNLTNQQYWIGYTTMNPQKPRSYTGSISFRF